MPPWRARRTELLGGAVAAALLLPACGPAWEGDGPAFLRAEVEVLPEMVLGCRARWTTDVPARGHVEIDGAWRTGATEGTEHEVLVIGMRPGERHELALVAEDDAGAASRSEGWTCEAGPLPDGIPTAEAVGAPGPDVPPHTLIDVVVQGGTAPFAAVVLDEEGVPTWYHREDAGAYPGAADVRLLDDGTVIWGGNVAEGQRPRAVNLAGEVVWEGPEQPLYGETGYMHHHLEPLDDGGALVLEKEFRDGVRGDRVVELGPGNERRWTWSTWDHMEPTGAEDWTHCNALVVDGDRLLLSVRNISSVVALDRTTGELLWTFGSGGDFALTAGSWPEFQHAISLTPEGWLAMFDNGAVRGWSRAVAYELDEQAMTAREAWSWDGRDVGAGFYAGYWGDVDVLPGGGHLVAVGVPEERRVIELDANDLVVHELVLEEGYGFYRAQRVDLSWEPLDAPSP